MCWAERAPAALSPGPEILGFFRFPLKAAPGIGRPDPPDQRAPLRRVPPALEVAHALVRHPDPLRQAHQGQPGRQPQRAHPRHLKVAENSTHLGRLSPQFSA